MRSKKLNNFLAGALAAMVTFSIGSSHISYAQNAKPLTIAEQGIFSAGGSVLKSDGTFDVSNYYTSRAGFTLHVDHANVLYQRPARESGLPMVFLHGYGQSCMSYMTTPDGREGWATMFLRKGHSVFLLDQPRRGEVLNQFFRQMTPDTAMDSAHGDQSIDNEVVASAVAATIDEVYNRTGKNSILLTHSQGGRAGWNVAEYTEHLAAIIAIEPRDAPAPNSEEYNALLKAGIPIVFY